MADASSCDVLRQLRPKQSHYTDISVHMRFIDKALHMSFCKTKSMKSVLEVKLNKTECCL